MEIGRYRCSILLFLCCTLAFIVFSFPGITIAATASAPAPTPAAKPAEPKPLAEDPLNRGTPYGTVIGFLRAADKSDYELAARYLEGKQPARQKEQLARDLKIVLNRGLKIGLDDLSKVSEGRLDDDLNVYLEKVGTATYDSESLDIVLRRTTKPDAAPIWLFSSETLRGVAAAAEQLDLGWGEAIWSDSFRDINVLSYPLFMLINQLVSLPVLLGIAWLLSHWLVKLFRPLLLRGSEEQRARTLTQFKWLLFVLIFSVTVRILSSKAVTVAGRIVFASIANVLMIVAASLLLVWLTRLATRSKILRLQQAGMPSTIATVELSGWLVVCACVIAGLFLTLRTLGLEATAAVAGLGVGGIAIAFAAQKTIENLFGTVTIVTDKPIHVGDYCQAGSTEGGVESIGLRSTRIRTLDRALVTIPNGQLAGMAIGNLTHRDKFLFRHNIRLRYETTADQLRQVLTNIRKMMWAHSKLEAGTIRIRLIRFADYSLDLEVFAYVLTHDTPAFLEIQEELLLAIMDIIEESGTSVALPFQTTPATENIDPDAPPGKVTQHRQPRAQRVS